MPEPQLVGVLRVRRHRIVLEALLEDRGLPGIVGAAEARRPLVREPLDCRLGQFLLGRKDSADERTVAIDTREREFGSEGQPDSVGRLPHQRHPHEAVHRQTP
jgi:hypothetical protein